MEEAQITYKLGLLEGRFDGVEDLLREAISTAKNLHEEGQSERSEVIALLKAHQAETTQAFAVRDARISALESDNRLWKITAGAVFATLSFLMTVFWAAMSGWETLKKFCLWLFSSSPTHR